MVSDGSAHDRAGLPGVTPLQRAAIVALRCPGPQSRLRFPRACSLRSAPRRGRPAPFIRYAQPPSPPASQSVAWAIPWRHAGLAGRLEERTCPRWLRAGTARRTLERGEGPSRHRQEHSPPLLRDCPRQYARPMYLPRPDGSKFMPRRDIGPPTVPDRPGHAGSDA